MNANLFKEERLRKIAELVESNGKVVIADLINTFDVSEMTIRRDLQALEDQGLVERIYGGAILPQHARTHVEPPTLERMDTLSGEKRAIARTAAQMVERDEMIFLGSGTTALYVAQELRHRTDITVVSNSLPVLNELAVNGKMTVIGVGGFLRRKELSLIGHFAETAIQDLHVDKIIVGIRGIHPHYGLTSDHPQEIQTDRTILSIGDRIIIVADHTKVGHVASIRVAPLTTASTIITTSQAPAGIVCAIRELGVAVKLIDEPAMR